MNEITHTIYVNEPLRTTANLSYKRKMLQNHTDRIHDHDEALFKLINATIAANQSGHIVDKLDEKANKLKTYSSDILEDMNQRIVHVVNHLNEQVEDINVQQLAMTYDDGLTVK